MEQKKIAWVQFMAAILSSGIVQDDPGIEVASKIVDKAVQKWDERYGDAAFMLGGQNECAACHKPLPPGSAFTASTDGLKFCNMDCLKGSGREE